MWSLWKFHHFSPKSSSLAGQNRRLTADVGQDSVGGNIFTAFGARGKNVLSYLMHYLAFILSFFFFFYKMNCLNNTTKPFMFLQNHGWKHFGPVSIGSWANETSLIFFLLLDVHAVWFSSLKWLSSDMAARHDPFACYVGEALYSFQNMKWIVKNQKLYSQLRSHL